MPVAAMARAMPKRLVDGGQRLREQEPGARRRQFADLRAVERLGFVRAGRELGAIAIVLPGRPARR
ncbi:MAG: hypothetical protein IPM40_21590 [Gammaproteobacteria bacterium]|nr:hypothetical protein [Gammaproteobacteria bacterium]